MILELAILDSSIFWGRPSSRPWEQRSSSIFAVCPTSPDSCSCDTSPLATRPRQLERTPNTGPIHPRWNSWKSVSGEAEATFRGQAPSANSTPHCKRCRPGRPRCCLRNQDTNLREVTGASDGFAQWLRIDDERDSRSRIRVGSIARCVVFGNLSVGDAIRTFVRYLNEPDIGLSMQKSRAKTISGQKSRKKFA